MAADHVAVAQYRTQGPLLTVQSSAPGIVISGDKPGTTDYVANCIPQQSVNLEAPLAATVGGIHYVFSNWLLDGQPQPAGQNTLAIAMDAADRKAFAVYTLGKAIITVQSLPAAGAAVIGSHPGTTNYQAACDYQESVTLTASATMEIDGLAWYFAYWNNPDGTSLYSPALTVVMDKDCTATANYIASQPVLQIQSAPFTGVAITGDYPGTTNYSVSCTYMQSVRVSAPATLYVDGKHYTFSRWVVDGTARAYGSASETVNMSANRTAVAEYHAVQYRLDVQSLPLRGFTITGSMTFTTDNVLWIDDQDIVQLQAPLSGTVEGNAYDFLNWTLDGVDQPAGQVMVQILMDGNHTVIAKYKGYSQIIIKGPMERGEGPCRPAVGTFRVDIFAKGMRDFRGIQVGPRFLDSAGQDAALPVSSTGGDPNFCGKNIHLNPAVFCSAFPVCAGTTSVFGAILTQDSVDIVDETWLLSATFEYGADDAGVYAFDPDPASTFAANSIPNVIPATVVSGHVILWQFPVLTVSSTGAYPVAIGGDKPGVTDYYVLCDSGQAVTLTAPDPVASGSIEYAFAYWMLDGVQQPRRQASLQIMMDKDRAATTVYNLFGDVNGDCTVNVMDLIWVRNHLGQDTGTGDAWKADLNQDGKVNVLDLISTRNRLGKKCP